MNRSTSANTPLLRPILLAPGPVQLHPEVQNKLALPMIHHRTPEFDLILKNVLSLLKNLFGTKENVYILSSTGSGGMEALLINVLKPQAKVLAIVSGKFGERWADMAEAYGAKVHRLNINWGEAVSPKAIEKYLLENPDTDIVMTQACETSTATLHPIFEISQIVKKTKALFLVDAITALGAMPIKMDEWSIDGLVAGSQKAIMLPTGVSLVSFSKKAWAVVENNPTPRFYFDLRFEQKANAKGETYFSSNVNLIRALEFVLTNIESTGGYDQLFNTIQRRMHYTHAMVEELGLELYSKNPSPTVTALKLPQAIDGTKFREQFEKKYAVTVMGGQDQLKGKVIRIGHMGYITDLDLHETTTRLVQCLNDFGLQLDLKKITAASENFLQSSAL